MGATFMLMAPVSAQSADESASPAESVTPGAEASAPSGLAAIEASFAARACDSFLSADELSSTAGVTVTGVSGGLVTPDSDRPGFVGLDCSWSVDGGTVSLEVKEREWTGKGKPTSKDLWDANDRGYSPDLTKLAAPGDAAYSDPGSEGGYYPGLPNVTWSKWQKHGKAYADRWVGLASDVLDLAALESLAAAVRSDATPGDAPLAMAPGDTAAPLIGSWTLAGWEDGPWEFPTIGTVTFTFDAAGTVTSTFDCERKGEKPLKDESLFFVDGDQIMTASDGEEPVGGCRATSPDEQILIALSDPIGSAAGATWTVDGETLTISGLPGIPTGLTFDRA
jgi:hypothetical protein